jgi:CobQ/CobB/MinD/ParA family nucleotide binding protein
MKHFAEARRDAVQELSQPTWDGQVERACLIWDLMGRLRLLVRPAPGVDAKALEANLRAALYRATEGFWGNECWIWRDSIDTAERLVYEKAWNQSIVVQGARVNLRELDRHLSKQTWFGAPLDPPWQLRPQMPPIISFFSFKGGVGRTTALTAFAIQMARAGKSVCVIDLDLEAPGAGSLFASSAVRPPYGLVDYLLERPLYEGQHLSPSDYFFICDDPDIIGEGAPITVVPAGNIDALYLEKLARLDYARMLRPDAPTPPLLDLLRQLRSERSPAYVLIDSRAGLHDIGGLALNGIAHLDVLFGLDSQQSWDGLGIVIDHLGRRRIEQGRVQQDCALIYAMAPSVTDPTRKIRVEQYIDRSHQIFTERFYDASPNEEWPVPAIDDKSQPHHAFAIGFDSELQRARALKDMVTPLTQGDYKAFSNWLLERLGRTSP